MEYYNESIAENDNVELVLYSCDGDKKGLEKFMTQHSAPWPAIDHRSLKRAKTIGKYSPKGIPSYILIDAEGNKIAEGKNAVQQKIAEISKES